MAPNVARRDASSPPSTTVPGAKSGTRLTRLREDTLSRPLITIDIDKIKDEETADLFHGWKSAKMPERNKGIPPVFELTEPGGEPLDPVTIKVIRLILEKLKEKPMVITVVSRKNYGKTVLISTIILQALFAGILDNVIWMSRTAHASSTMKWLPRENIVQGFNPEFIEALLNFKQQLATAATEAGVDSEDLQAMREAGVAHDCLVFDDLLGEQQMVNNYILKRGVSTHRHPVVTMIIGNQTGSVALTPDLKQNSDLIILGRNIAVETVKMHMAVDYDGNEREFAQFIKEFTRARGLMLVYNCFTQKQEFDERWAVIRGPNLPLHKMFRVQNEHAVDYLVPPASDDEEDEDEEQVGGGNDPSPPPQNIYRPRQDQNEGNFDAEPTLYPNTHYQPRHRRPMRMMHGQLFPGSYMGIRGLRPPWAQSVPYSVISTLLGPPRAPPSGIH